MSEQRDADMSVIRQKVAAVRSAVDRISREVERLRRDMEQTAGECREAYRLVIADKIQKMERLVVLLSHNVLDHTLYDPVQPFARDITRP